MPDLGMCLHRETAIFHSREGFLRSVVSILYRIALRRAHAVIFQNSDDIEEFTKRKIISASKVIKIGGTGVDLDQWPFSTAGDGARDLSACGSIAQGKGYH